MTPIRLAARSLLHYRAVNSAVALGVGVGTAVLAGALIVGSSVRGSLRDLTLDRLGSIDFALLGERYFQETLRDAVAEPGAAAAGILIRGSAENADTGARAAKVRLHGVDTSFWSLFGADVPELGMRDIAINRRLADELGIAEGDALLLRFHTDSLIPAESVMGRKTDSVRLFRMQVAAVLDNSGPGRFGLSPQQQLPHNAFVSREMLQRSLEQPGRANALFVSGGTLEAAQTGLREAFTAADARIAVRRVPAGGGILVESDRIVLERAAADAIREAADASLLGATEVLTYLANSMEANDRSVPYSTVTALQSLPGALRLVGGARARLPRGDEILINAWTADQLGLVPDDEIRLTYYVVGPGGELGDFVTQLPRGRNRAHDRSGRGPAVRPRVPGHVGQGADVELGPALPHRLGTDPAPGRRVLGPLPRCAESLRQPGPGEGPLVEPLRTAHILPPCGQTRARFRPGRGAVPSSAEPAP